MFTRRHVWALGAANRLQIRVSHQSHTTPLHSIRCGGRIGGLVGSPAAVADDERRSYRFRASAAVGDPQHIARIHALLGTTRNPDQKLKHHGRCAAAGWNSDPLTPFAPEDKRPEN